MVSHHIPTLSNFQARDESELFYRHYPSVENTNTIMILIHGITEDSKYLAPLATFISENSLANVFTPDLRGYGENPIQRGDLDYIGQLEDDLADLIEVIKQQNPESTIVLAGHSAGGGTAIRFAASKYTSLVNKYLLLSPLIHFQAPTMKDSDASTAYKGRLIALMVANRFGYRRKNHLPVLVSNKPKELQHGTETLTLSYRLFMSRIPDNYKKALAKLPDDTLLLIGDQDQEFAHTEFAPLLARYSKTDVGIIADVDHDGILSNEEAWQKIQEWI